MMRTGRQNLLFLLLLFSFLTTALGGAELSTLLFADEAKLWKSTPALWTKDLPRSLRPENAKLSKFRYYAPEHPEEKRHLLFGEAIQEMNLEFDGGKLKKIDISVYNRGDAGYAEIRDFQAELRKITAKFDELTGNKAKKESTMLAQSRLDSMTWPWGGDSAIRLKWSKRGNAPEFLSVEIGNAAAFGKIKSDVGAESAATDLKSRVKHAGAGEVFLEVPMTNQGAKGYCAAAVIERVMKYYGGEVDQHIIANLAGSSAGAGTSIPMILQELGNAAPRLNVRLKILYRSNIFDGVDGLNRMLNAYNSEARRARKKSIRLESFITDKGNMRFFNPEQMFRSMDNNCFIRARQREKRKFQEFEQNIREYIEQGIPVAWTVLGIDETGRYLQHMRIINGYCYESEPRKIIYTDSWGMEHKRKKINSDHAWAITSSYFVLLPRNK